MNKSKKLTAAVAASAVASALVAPAAFAATELTDIDGSFAKDAIKELVEKGIINGKGDGKFDPTGQIERQDFAIILAKALNLDVAAAPATATFSDVPTTHYSFKFVEAAVKAGLIKGNGDGTFGNGSNLSRQDMAALFVRALGTDVTGKGKDLKFSDAGEIADYAKDAVAAAVELGLISGNGDGTFNPNGNAERQAVALVASKFLKAKAETQGLTGATVVDNTTVTLTFSKELAELKATDVKVADKASGAAVSVGSVTLAADKKSATVKVTALAAGTTYTATVGGKTVEFTTAAKAEVTSVSAINLKQIKVEFNSAVDAASVESNANYALTDKNGATVTGYTPALQEDGKTVLLTLYTGQLINQESYKLKTSSLKDKLGLPVTNAEKTFVPFDNNVPTAKEVTVVGPNSLKVTFSAPIAATTNSNYTLDNGTVSVTTGSAGIDGTQYYVILNVGANLSEGDHTLKVKGARGYNNYNVEEQNLTFKFAKDTVAPTATVSSVKLFNDTTAAVVGGKIRTKATIKFSEPVLTTDGNDLANDSIYALYNGLSDYKALTVTKATGATEFTSNGRVYADTFTAVFDTVVPTGSITFYLNNTTTASIKDAWGNAFTSAPVSYNHDVDTVKPTVVTTKVEDQKNVVVEFSEYVDAASAKNFLNYTLYKEDGTVFTSNTAGVDSEGHPSGAQFNWVDATKQNKLRITFPANISAGNLTLKASGVKDMAVPTANKLDEVSLALSFVDTTNPIVTRATYVDNQTVIVTFSKEMDAASITDLNNYKFGGNVLAKVDGVTATALNNNKAVKLSFPTAQTFSGGAQLSYGHLKDSLGNYTTTFEDVATLQADKIQVADIINAQAVSQDTVTFEVKQQLTGIDLSLITFQGVEILSSGGQAYYWNTKVDNGKVDGALVTVKLASGQVAANKLYSDVSGFTGLIVEAGALKNANGNALERDVNFVADSIAVADAIAPEVVSAVTLNDAAVKTEQGQTPVPADNNNNIKGLLVTFSEDMKASTIGEGTFAVSGYSVTDVKAISSTKFLVIVTKKGYVDGDVTPAVSLLKDVKDVSDNVMEATTDTGVDTTDGI